MESTRKFTKVDHQQADFNDDVLSVDNDTLISSDFLSDSDGENDGQERDVDFELSAGPSKTDDGQTNPFLGDKEMDTGWKPSTLLRERSNGSGCGIAYFEPRYFATSSFVEAVLPVLISQDKQRIFMLLKFHLNQSLVVEITFYMLFSEWLYFPFQIASIRVNLREYFIQNGLALTNGLEVEYVKNVKAVFRQKRDSSTRDEHEPHIAQKEFSRSECQEGLQKLQVCTKHTDKRTGLPEKVLNKYPMICGIPPKLQTVGLEKFAFPEHMSFPNPPQVELVVNMVLSSPSSCKHTDQAGHCNERQQCLSHVPEIEGNSHPEITSTESIREEPSQLLNNDQETSHDHGNAHPISLVEDSQSQHSPPFHDNSTLDEFSFIRRRKSSFSNNALSENEMERCYPKTNHPTGNLKLDFIDRNFEIFDEDQSQAKEKGLDIEKFSNTGKNIMQIFATKNSDGEFTTLVFTKDICQNILPESPVTKSSSSFTASARSNSTYICMEEDPAEYRLEKIINIPGQDTLANKRHTKRLLDHNRALRIPFDNSILTHVENAKYNPLNSAMQAIVHAYPETQSVGVLFEKITPEKIQLCFSLFNRAFEQQRHISLYMSAKSIMHAVKFPLCRSLPEMRNRKLNSKDQLQIVPMKNNSPFKSHWFPHLPPKFNPTTMSKNKTKNKKRNKKATEPTQSHASSDLFQNVPLFESGKESIEDEHLGPQRLSARYEVDFECNFKDEFEIATYANLAVSNNSDDSTENHPDDYIPQEIKRCVDLSQNVPPDSAYGTQSKPTLDGMNEYHETYVQSLKQNYGNPQTEQKILMNSLPKDSDRRFYSKNGNHITRASQSVTSGNSQNVLQIDPLFAKELANCGIPFTDVTLNLPSNIFEAQGSKREDEQTRPPGLTVELELQADVKKLDEEFKELHRSSSRESSGRGNDGKQHATHIITVDLDCYQRLHEACISLNSNGLLQPPYARTVTAMDESYLVDYLSRLKNNTLENHCGLIFRNEMIQRLVNRKETFRINQEYEVLERLGSGGHGSAYLCVCKGMEGGKPFVIKKCPRSSFNEEEISIPLRYGNMYTRMLDVYGIVLEGEEVSVIMEYANGGTLKAYRNSPERNVYFLVAALHRLLKIIYEVHLLGIFHFDIKEENIAFTHSDNPDSATLLDWGSAKYAKKVNQKYCNGTKRFYPPELLTRCNAMDLEKHDIWTLGCAILSNMNGSFVFGKLWESCDRGQKKTEYQQGLLNGRVITDELVKGNLPACRLLLHLTDLLMWMLDPDVSSRASVLEALYHPVFNCCVYESSTALSELERSTESPMKSLSTSHIRGRARVVIHYKDKVVHTARVHKGYPVKRLVEDETFKQRVDLCVCRHEIQHGYCLLKNNRFVFNIDENCYLELRPT